MKHQPRSLALLRSANPVSVDPTAVRSPQAAAAFERIVTEPRNAQVGGAGATPPVARRVAGGASAAGCRRRRDQRCGRGGHCGGDLRIYGRTRVRGLERETDAGAPGTNHRCHPSLRAGRPGSGRSARALHRGGVRVAVRRQRLCRGTVRVLRGLDWRGAGA